MRRDKIITVRVDSDLLKQVQEIIDSRTTIFEYINRKHYHYIDEKGYSHEKYTIADLLENAMREYIKNVPKGTK